MQSYLKSINETQFSRKFIKDNSFELNFNLIKYENKENEQISNQNFYEEAFQLVKINLENTSKTKNNFLIIDANQANKDFIKLGKNIKILCFKEISEKRFQFVLYRGAYEPKETASVIIKVFIFDKRVSDDEIIDNFTKREQIKINNNCEEEKTKKINLSNLNINDDGDDENNKMSSSYCMKTRSSSLSKNKKLEKSMQDLTNSTINDDNLISNSNENLKKLVKKSSSTVSSTSNQIDDNLKNKKIKSSTPRVETASSSSSTSTTTTTAAAAVPAKLKTSGEKISTIRLSRSSSSSSSSSSSFSLSQSSSGSLDETPKIVNKKTELKRESDQEFDELNKDLLSNFCRQKRLKKSTSIEPAIKTTAATAGATSTTTTTTTTTKMTRSKTSSNKSVKKSEQQSNNETKNTNEKNADNDLDAKHEECDERLKKITNYIEKYKKDMKLKQEVEENIKKLNDKINENSNDDIISVYSLESRNTAKNSSDTNSSTNSNEDASCIISSGEDSDVIYVQSKEKKLKKFNYELIDFDGELEEEISKISDISMLTPELIRYMTLRDVNYYVNIFAGQCEHSWRHIEFKKHSNKSSKILYSNAAICSYREEQYMSAIKALQSIFCKQNHKYDEYIVKVLLPEALIKFCMRIYQCSKEDAEDYLHKNNYRNPINFKDKDLIDH